MCSRRGRRAWRNCGSWNVRPAIWNSCFVWSMFGELLEAGHDAAIAWRICAVERIDDQSMGMAAPGSAREFIRSLSPFPIPTFPAVWLVPEHAFRDARDHLDFAARAGVPLRAAVAEADVVEHRLLRGRLRLFVAGETGRMIVSRARPWAWPVLSVVLRYTI